MTKPLVSKKRKINSPYFKIKLNKHIMATKTVDLSISERVAASKIINDFKGNITTLALLVDDVKKIAITDEEWVEAELVKTPILDAEQNPTGNDNWQWKDKDGAEKSIELDTAIVTFLTDEIKKKSDANEITIGDVALIGLNKKLLQ